MHTLAIHNQKGGTGKSMTALCLNRCLADLGYRTLFVDADEQWNVTKQFGILSTKGEATIYDLLTDPDIDVHEAVRNTPSGDIVPGDAELKDAAAAMLQLPMPVAMLADALAPLAGEYDWIVIDCPPSLGLVTKNAYVASDRVIVPVYGDTQSVENLSAITEEIARIAAAPRLNPELRLGGLLMTQYDARTALCRQVVKELPEIAEHFGTESFDTVIRLREAARKACAAHRSPFDVPDARDVCEDYAAFTRELIEKLIDRVA